MSREGTSPSLTPHVSNGSAIWLRTLEVIEVVRQEQCGFEVLFGRARLALVPGGARRVKRGRQFTGEQLLLGMENLPSGRHCLRDGAGVQPRGDQREQVHPSLAAAGADRDRFGLSDPVCQPDYLVRVTVLPGEPRLTRHDP